MHVALLPNGKVLAYDSVGDRATETFPVHDFTRATVWDPETGTHTNVNVTGYNVFCSGLAHLMDGSLFLAGGNRSAALDGIVQTHVFNYQTNTWSLGPNMAAGRWYPTVTPLRNGEMLITEGGPDIPEVRTTAGALRRLTTASLNLPLYPWIHAAPDGRAFYAGPNQTMRALNTDGTGAWQTFGQRDAINRDYGSHALYDIGRILVAGGGASSADARTININGATPQVTATAPMANGRRQHNLTVLADGSVLATGGNSSGAGLVDLNNGVYVGELWTPTTGNPATGTWKTLAAETATRQYHSTALLLPDGRVVSSGGGICGTCDQVGYLAKNAQVFTPPYLFKTDGSGELAPRPAIASAPASVAYGAGFQIDTPDAAAIRKVALVRLGAVTHSVNMEQRYVPLTFTAGAGALTATAPANANIAPPGVYMLFITDANGVPSVAKMVTVSTTAPDTSPPTAPTGLTATASGSSQVNLSWTAATDNVGVTGYRVERCQGAGLHQLHPGRHADRARRYSDTGRSASTTYRYRVRAADAAGNLGGYSRRSRRPPPSAAPPAPTGLVGAWGFSEGTGTTTADASGNGNVGTITGATWSTQGRYGNALSFNGTNSLVRVASAASLNLGSAMTLSAWIRPTASPERMEDRSSSARPTPTSCTPAATAPLQPGRRRDLRRQHRLPQRPDRQPASTPGRTWPSPTTAPTLRLYVNGTQAATARRDRRHPDHHQPALDRRQPTLRRVLPRTHRRSPRLQPRAHPSRDPDRHEHAGRAGRSRHDAAVGAVGADRHGGRRHPDQPQLDRLDRQRRRHRLPRRALPGRRPAPTSPRSARRPRRRSTTPGWQPRPPTATGCAPSTRPTTSARTPTIASATTAAAPDTTPPSAPTGLAGTAVSMTQINLTWTASTDNVGVTGYRVERCQGADLHQLRPGRHADRRRASADTGLAPSTSYRFRVRAVDAAGNLSAYSDIATATTLPPDTTPPTAPSGLTATAAGSTQVNLAWTASTDNVGVTGYRVERCQGAGCTNFTQVATPTATTFSDTGLAGLDHLPLPGPRRRRGRQPQPVLRDRRRHHRPQLRRRRPAWSAHGRSARERAPRPPTPPATATSAPSRAPRGRPRAATATH